VLAGDLSPPLASSSATRWHNLPDAALRRARRGPRAAR
jgi:hypothetical protein